MSLISPVSAKAAKGTTCLSLPSDSSAIATRPLICSSWLGRWMDWQMDVKTPPIRHQSSSLVHSCRDRKMPTSTTSQKEQNGPVEDKSQPRFPPQREPRPGTPDREQGQFLFDDKDRINQCRRFRALAAMLGLNEVHLLAKIRVCTDDGLNFTFVWKTVHPVKAQHESGCSHLPTCARAHRHTHTHTHTSCTQQQNSCVSPSVLHLERELHKLR